MQTNTFHLAYADTGYFSGLVKDYLSGCDTLREFYRYTPNLDGIDAAIRDREQFPVDRKLLTNTLHRQYQGLEHTEETLRNLELLREDNCFTICTAHQPNLMTGYLYFVYKIIHAIKLAEILNNRYPEKHFVPVYYMGSEDNDLAELGTFRYEGRQYKWEANGQKGAVGRMQTESLKPLLDELFRYLGPPGPHTDHLKQLLTDAYLNHETVGAATRYLVHQLFGKYGLIVLNPDDADLKKAFIPVLKDELLQQNSFPLAQSQTARLSEFYKSQAFPRPVNLFYLHDQMRERIEKQGDKWIVVNSEISWTQSELLGELEARPERFSPNVILRGLFQETILPDVAFIGGGSEVAYWLQLKLIFDHYGVFFPPLLLRQSALWITQKQSALRKALDLSLQDLFLEDADLIRSYLSTHGSGDWHINEEMKAMELIISQISQKAVGLDPTLEGAVGAAQSRIKKHLERLEEKMYRAEKRREEVQVRKMEQLKSELFPGGNLQERADNFLPWYIQWGSEYFDLLKNSMEPIRNEFLIIEETA